MRSARLPIIRSYGAAWPAAPITRRSIPSSRARSMTRDGMSGQDIGLKQDMGLKQDVGLENESAFLSHRAGALHSSTASSNNKVRIARRADDIVVMVSARGEDRIAQTRSRPRPQADDPIAGVETVDHPNDAQLVVYAREYSWQRIECGRTKAPS